MMASGRFDVHAHYKLPDAPAPGAAADNFIASPMAQWSPETALEFMEQYGIETQMLSVPIPLEPASARAVNVYGAEVVRQYPERFGLLASLPMMDIAATLEEIDFAFDTLGADGVIMMTNYDGHYLGDPRFEPIFQALDRRKATIFLHPTTPAGYECVACGRPGPLIEYPFDTCRTVTDMLFAGIIERYDSINLILPHAGGPLPTLAPRLGSIGTTFYVPHPPEMTRQTVREQLSRLYFDTAIAGSAASILPVLELVGTDHILFGTDFPPATASVIRENVDALDSLSFLSAEEKDGINRNGRSLFRRFCGVAADA